MLSGVVSKVAAYGFLRIVIVKFPEPTHDFRVPILVLASIGLVYGSLLAFRAPDIRGVIAYSSLAQMGLITLGIFANNDLGFDGSVLQMVNHGLISASLFLLAGMVERRTATGELSLLGGMARGRPALATVLMTTGVIALAVPLSTAFAGEFLILAGVFQQGWGWAVVGAISIVLAAMYVLRLISAVLHQKVGPAVSEAALDLRPGELVGRRPARRDPRRALGVAGRDQRPRVRRRARAGGRGERARRAARRRERARGGRLLTRDRQPRLREGGGGLQRRAPEPEPRDVRRPVPRRRAPAGHGHGPRRRARARSRTSGARRDRRDRQAARRLVRARADARAPRRRGRCCS